MSLWCLWFQAGLNRMWKGHDCTGIVGKIRGPSLLEDQGGFRLCRRTRMPLREICLPTATGATCAGGRKRHLQCLYPPPPDDKRIHILGHLIQAECFRDLENSKSSILLEFYLVGPLMSSTWLTPEKYFHMSLWLNLNAAPKMNWLLSFLRQWSINKNEIRLEKIIWPRQKIKCTLIASL